MSYINKVRRSYLNKVAEVCHTDIGSYESDYVYGLKKYACNEIVLEFLEIKNNDLVIEGYYIVLADSTADNSYLQLTINEKDVIVCDAINGRHDGIIDGKDKNLLVVPFSGIIPNISLCNHVNIKVDLIHSTKGTYEPAIHSGRFFPFCLEFQHAYAVVGHWLVRMDNNILLMEPVDSKALIDAEHKLCEEYMSLNDDDAEKAVYYRYFYHCYKAMNRREIWLISDQWYRADDNGEALFAYIKNNKAANQDVYFVLSRDSVDYERAALYGKVIEPNSFEHRLYRLMADKICLSHVDDIFVDKYFHNKTRYYQDILCNGKYVFLQHGITQNNVSNYLNRFVCNFSLLTVGGAKEQYGFTHGKYFYDDSVVQTTGLARYDNLTDNSDKTIVIMPTWRANLADWTNINIDGTAVAADDFNTSAFFQFYNALLNDVEFIDYVRKNGYKIKFMAHPNVRPFLDRFQRNDLVEFCKPNTRYKDLFAEGSLLVTDYSSVAFDFAYLNKPVIYCQFDREYFFSEHYQAGYFDYETDGFGEVTCDVYSTIKCIKDYISNDCSLKDKYRKRIMEFFKHNDRNNCERIYEAISNLKPAHVFNSVGCGWSAENIFSSLSAVSKLTPGVSPLYELTYRYVFPCHLFEHIDKVVIYGAGKVGLEFYFQNITFNFVNVVSVIDKKSDNIDVKDLLVENIDALSSKIYDYVLLAVLDEKLAKSIKEDLIKRGVDEKKIKWDGKRYSWLDFFAGGGFDELVQNVGCR